MITKLDESYKLLMKGGRKGDASVVKKKLIECKFAKEHLKMAMNLDFAKPTQKMKDMAKQYNIDLKDKAVIEEFKRI